MNAMDVESIGKKATETINTFRNEYLNNDQGLAMIIFIIIGLIIVIFIFWAYSLTSLEINDCKRLDKIFENNQNRTGKLFEIVGSTYSIYPFVNYYIKTAHNCCSPGNFSNSFVSLCALKNNINLGARCLDFQIFSLDLEPVIATSSKHSSIVRSFFMKETFNSLKLKDVLHYIKFFALENNNDPLFLHFRIMTNVERTIDLIYTYLNDILNDYLLGTVYSVISNNNPILTQTLENLKNRCIIMVNDNRLNRNVINKSRLKNIINIFTGNNNNNNNNRASRYFRNSTLLGLNQNAVSELIRYNMNNLTLVLPDNNHNSINFNPNIGFKSGCQFIGMNFQRFDSNLEFYFTRFRETGYNFLLKPKKLRHIPQYVVISTSHIPKGTACERNYCGDTSAVTLKMDGTGDKCDT